MVAVPFLFYALFMIWWTVRQKERRTRQVSEFSELSVTKSRMVTRQALMYGIFFFNTYSWTSLGPILTIILSTQDRSLSDSTFYVTVRVLTVLFYTSQGFWNFLIFVQPRYQGLRTDHEEKPRIWAFAHACAGTNLVSTHRSSSIPIPKSKKSSTQSSSTSLPIVPRSPNTSADKVALPKMPTDSGEFMLRVAEM